MASGLFMSFKFQCSKHFVISGARNLNRIKFAVVFRWVYPIKHTGFFVMCLSVSPRGSITVLLYCDSCILSR